MQKITDNIFFLVLLAMIGSALLVVSFIFLIIYNSNRLLKQKRKLQEVEINYQKELLYAVIGSQEKERQRIGMDLHDEVGATLSALRLIIEEFIDKAKTLPETNGFCMQSKSIIDSVITTIRNISHDLSPLGKGSYNFIDALEDLKDKVDQTGKLQMTLQHDCTYFSSLPNTTSLALYRVFAELINNTIKHAHAQQIFLSIVEQETKLVFNYKDDGIGILQNINKVKDGIGMRNIESRLRMIQADFEINHKQSKGFEIQIALNK